MLRRGLVSGICGALILLGALSQTLGMASTGQEVRVIETRPGITVRVLVITPIPPPKGVLIMFPGNGGAGSFRQSGDEVVLGDNFLVRTAPEFAARGFAAAIVDSPSDYAAGMPDSFRRSPAHAQDVQKVIEDLARQSLQPAFLVGTSRGTISAAYLATVLTGPQIKGVVLTSTMGSRYTVGLSFGRIAVPVLIVHHRDDECRANPFGDAAQLPHLLTGSPRVTFVEVHGGSAPRSSPCEALSAHGYLGMERPVVDIITHWLAGEPVPASVGR